MASRRRKAEDYPRQVVTKRGIVELRLSPAAMHDLLAVQLRLPADEVLRLAHEEIERHPRQETFWKLVAYVALRPPLPS